MRLFGIAFLLFFVVPFVGIVHDVESRRQHAAEQCKHHRTFVEKDTGLRRPCVNPRSAR